MAAPLSAEAVEAQLRALRSDEEREKTARRFVGRDDTEIIGVRMRDVFATAKAATDMSLPEVERLLESPAYECRMVAVSVLDFKARRSRLSDDERRELYDLYIRRHDRIDTWDLVDRSAPRVVGTYLRDHDRAVLDRLSRSDDAWERRTAITATFLLIREGDVDDALRIAEVLLDDPEPLVLNSVGTALREVGVVDPPRLVAFVERHGTRLPRAALRTAVSKLDPAERKRLLDG